MIRQSCFVIALSLTTACGMVQVKGPHAASSSAASAPSTSRTSSPASAPSPSSDATAETSTSSAAAPVETKTVDPDQARGDSDAARNIMVESGRASEIKRTGRASISSALDGFSSDAFKTYISSFYTGSAKPSNETLASATDARVKQKAAFEEAAAANKMSFKKKDTDPKTLKQIKDHFVEQNKGVVVKSAHLEDNAWHFNKDELGRTRNRYKTAEIVIGVKNSSACLLVLAVAGQNSDGKGGYSSNLEFDEPLEGIATTCP